MKRPSLFAAALVAVLGAGCSNLLSALSTSPTTVTIDSMAGSWSSVSSATSLTDTCTNFHWAITDISGSTASGTFSATCLTDLQIAGTANGTLSGTTVTWTAVATGTAPGGVSCPISLSGTATYDGTQIRVPYTGTTCLGPVSGTEILKKS